jgi:histidinol-phosphate aminotransferase
VSALPAVAQRRLASLRVYNPGSAASTAAGKLSSNEAPLGPAPGVRSAIAAAGAAANRYPSAERLTRALAAHEGVAEDRLIVTNGSDELCYLIATLFIEPGARVVLSEPCYQIDELVSRLARGEPELVPLRADGGHDLDAMAAAADAGAAVLWLPTPHNPTGVAVDPGELTRLLERAPRDCLVVLDEAYRSYVDPELRPDSRELVAEHPNLLVQRTFSKSYALAGLRLGYGFGAPELIGALNGIRPPFNVNAAAIAAGEAALANTDWRDYSVELVRRERERLASILTELGIDHFRSQANFVTVRVPEPDRLRAALLEAGLVVRDGEDLGLRGWLRISIGAPPEMATLRAVLREVARA